MHDPHKPMHTDVVWPGRHSYTLCHLWQPVEGQCTLIVVMLLFSFPHSAHASSTVGKYWLCVIGSSVLHQQPRNCCAGLVHAPSLGVFHQSRRARCSDSLAPHICSTAASPHFVRLEVVRRDCDVFKLHFWLKEVNSAIDNCGPLCVTRVSGTPYSNKSECLGQLVLWWTGGIQLQ